MISSMNYGGHYDHSYDDAIMKDLRKLMGERWVEPAEAWMKFLSQLAGDMTVLDLISLIAKVTQFAECDRCGRFISSHNGNFWYHIEGGYRQCASVEGLANGDTRKAKPKSGTVRSLG